MALLGALAFSVWSLTLRPYPDGQCDAPLELVLSDAPEVPRLRGATPRVTLPDDLGTRPVGGEIDYDALRKDLDERRRLGSAAERAGQRKPVVTSNAYEVAVANVARDAHQACVGQLTSAGFWWRGTIVPVALLAALAAGRFILGDRRQA